MATTPPQHVKRERAPTDVPRTTVPAHQTQRGDTWRIEVAPSDGEEEGPFASAEVVTSNVRTVADSAVIVPTEAYEATRLVPTPTGSGFDDEDLTWSYTWFVQGGEVKSGADDWLDGASFDTTETARGDTVTLLTQWFVNKASVSKGASLGGTAFKRGDNVEVELTPFDREDAGPAVRSPTVTIANTPPRATSVTHSPKTAYTDTTLSAAAATVDADTDTVALAWTWAVNGKTLPDLSSTPSSSNFSKSDRVQAWVTLGDSINKTGSTLYTTYAGDTGADTQIKAGERWTCAVVESDGVASTSKVTSESVTAKASSSCGDRVRNTGQEYEPALSPFTNVKVKSGICRWDFSIVEPLYGYGSGSGDGSSNCGKADADTFFQLKTDNKKSTSTSFNTALELTKPGFSCSPHTSYGTTIFTDRGVKADARSPTWQDTPIWANHGAGTCTNPLASACRAHRESATPPSTVRHHRT
ncbi:MAG: hypothetical protein ACI9MC_004227 [Kiritimatiellia bacterium]|jgi:hypothetical protein